MTCFQIRRSSAGKRSASEGQVPLAIAVCSVGSDPVCLHPVGQLVLFSLPAITEHITYYIRYGLISLRNYDQGNG